MKERRYLWNGRKSKIDPEKEKLFIDVDWARMFKDHLTFPNKNIIECDYIVERDDDFPKGLQGKRADQIIIDEIGKGSKEV